MNKIKIGIIAIIAVVAIITTAFTFPNEAKVAVNSIQSATELIGAGATFPYPLYSKMFDEYNKTTGVKVNYQSIGSGGGIKQLTSKTVDFGASDAFLSEEQLKAAPAPIVHVPTCLGAVVLTYNLPGNPKLKLTPDVIAGIFLGTITKWNDAKIKAANPTIALPDLAVFVVHRSDGSGTTFCFTDYLCKVSPDWNTKVGKKTSVDWPAGLGAKGNEGVSGMVKQTPGAIGYVELIYAVQNKMQYGSVKNSKGNFIDASIKSVTSAANVTIPADARVSLTNTDAADGYPISSFTWILLYKDQNYDGRAIAKAQAATKLVWWMTHEGQKLAEPLNYAPLPAAAQKVAEANLKSINFGGKPLL
jgi:phosphate transport system substrate-binding protein